MNVSDVEHRLDALIEHAGVSVITTKNLSPDLNACYLSETNTIYVRKGLDPVTRVCAIAHELGHAFYGHDCSNPRFERVADAWAARKLLNGRVSFDLMREYRDAPGALAAELGVSPRLLMVWLECGVLHRESCGFYRLPT